MNQPRNHVPLGMLRASPVEMLQEHSQPSLTVGQHPARLRRGLARLAGGSVSRSLRFGLMLLTMVGLVWLANAMVVAQSPASVDFSQSQSPASATSAATRRLRPWEVGAVIYDLFPELPKENQYQPLASAETAIDNTLVSRLIRYHLYVKNRPSTYRLDWKLTLADYLGVNEMMWEGQYPGHDTLRTNPLAGDRAAIARLSRRDRDRLVELLVRAFNPLYDRLVLEAATYKPVQSPVPVAAPPSAPSTLPPLPRPGDAQLLAP